MTRTTDASPAIFTIVSANYIALAATLMQSVRRHHPDARRFIVLADADQTFGAIDLAAEVIQCDALGIALVENMKLWYSVVEFNTSIKPYVFRYLFQKIGVRSAIYLDPDIQVFGPLEHVTEALRDHSLVLTPHITRPLQDGREPSDLSIMKSGVYNLGFGAILNDPDGAGLVDWWCGRLFAHCRVDVRENMFTDQRWIDMAPALVERVSILRHPSYNVAYWNLAHRTVELAPGGRWLVNGEPLRFFHFSGIDIDDPELLSRHQNRFGIDDFDGVASLFEAYRTAVMNNGWRETSGLPYAFGVFRDGRIVENEHRRWLLRAIDENRLPRHERLRVGAAFFDAPDEEVFVAGGRLTRYASQLWRERSDLLDAFDLRHPGGFASYLDWFCDGAALEEGIDPRSVASMRMLRGVPPAAVGPDLEPSVPPWQPVSRDVWTGDAKDVVAWLAADVEFVLDGAVFTLPRQAALLWERRADLQRAFVWREPKVFDAYLTWIVTAGMIEGMISADSLSEAFLGVFNALAGDHDIPVTAGMLLVAKLDVARLNFRHWFEFPRTRLSRLDHAFWFAYVAPRMFGWSAAMIREIRAYFAEPCGIDVGAYPLTRGMLAVWEMRADLQSTFDLRDESGRWKYLGWLVTQCAAEYDLDRDELCFGLAEFLRSASCVHESLTGLDEFVYRQRDDLRAHFDIAIPSDAETISAVLAAERARTLAEYRLGSLLCPAGPQAPIRTRICLSGDWRAPTGIGEDLRASVVALNAVGCVEFVIVDIPSGQVLAPDGTVLPPGRKIIAGCNIVHRNAVTALEDFHTLRTLGVSAARSVGHWAWELERMPSGSRFAFSFYDEVLAASHFAREAFAAEQLRPVRLMSNAVTVPPAAANVTRTSIGLDDEASLFLFMFDFASYAARKNPAAVIRAFHRAFPEGTERVQLMIKTQNAGAQPAFWLELAGQCDDPRIVLRDATMARGEVIDMIAMADAFVSLHRSEGFGRGPAEAMLLGKPVIMTAYSGTNDFADPDCACLVDYTLIPVQTGEYPGAEGQRWADPDIAGAARWMRWVHEHPSEAKAMGERGRLRVGQQLAPARIGAAMLSLLA